MKYCQFSGTNRIMDVFADEWKMNGMARTRMCIQYLGATHNKYTHCIVVYIAYMAKYKNQKKNI